ncbi:hypothetical protein HUJ04_001280 [Dendroctonus ponderosae]|nr:hypothetical protein HUJ04_001280 [Dendroctonus ponderosae]
MQYFPYSCETGTIRLAGNETVICQFLRQVNPKRKAGRQLGKYPSQRQSSNMQKLPFGFTSKEIIDQGRTSRENIDAVKQWLSSVDSAIIPRVQDELVVIFLLSCDNDLPLTKHTITMYYKCKRNSPDIFDNREMDRADLKKAMNSIHMCSLPVRTDENYAIHHFKLNDTNYLNFDLVPVMKLSYMLLDITQEKDLPRGLVVIIDCKGVGLMHLTRMKIGPMRRYFQFLQEGFPIQMKVIHIINAVYFFDKFLNVVKLCTKSELMEMANQGASAECGPRKTVCVGAEEMLAGRLWRRFAFDGDSA